VQPGAGHGLAVLAADAAVDREPLPRLRVGDQCDGAAQRRSRPPCDGNHESSGKDGKGEPELCYGARLPGCESCKHVETNISGFIYEKRERSKGFVSCKPELGSDLRQGVQGSACAEHA